MPSPDLPALIARARTATADADLATRAVPLLDLTSLRGDESSTEIEALCDRAERHGTAAVCIYRAHLALARKRLAGGTVRLATVANFPDGSDDLARAAEETAAAVAAGADEVDVVAPIQAIRDGDIGLVGELVEACREAAGARTTLKLILETGSLREPDLITAAARTAVMAGIDFLKTSTGKAAVGATLEAAALLLAVIEEAGGRVGFKAAGGIRTAADAAAYLALADAIMGPDWASPRTFRFGASSLLDDLLRVAGREEAIGTGGSY
ncbi:deoxyribose-phosphate aldolase [Benzoatithermus flavus]|uniref:Deoxyribose-phosphate aldolase n=1 Tax=Benzoatithermus flavus TaxID=3108223 RepID=A0ABU8XQG6_9PROT